MAKAAPIGDELQMFCRKKNGDERAFMMREIEDEAGAELLGIPTGRVP